MFDIDDHIMQSVGSCGADCVAAVRSLNSLPVTVSADDGNCMSLEFE